MIEVPHIRGPREEGEVRAWELLAAACSQCECLEVSLRLAIDTEYHDSEGR